MDLHRFMSPLKKTMSTSSNSCLKMAPISRSLYRYTNIVFLTCLHVFSYRRLAASSGKRNVTIWRPSVCPSARLSCQHTHRDSPVSSMRRGQRTFRPYNKEDRRNLFSNITKFNNTAVDSAMSIDHSLNLEVYLHGLLVEYTLHFCTVYYKSSLYVDWHSYI